MGSELEAAVERRVHAWETWRKEQSSKSPSLTPIVAIGGAHGAEREAVALCVAEALDFHYFDREIITHIAQHCGVLESAIEALDEHRINAFVEALAGFSVKVKPHAADYRKELSMLISTITEHGRAVVVGRGGRFLVPKKQCLRVYVTAPLDARIKNVVAGRSISRDAAKAEIERIDADRARFIKDYFDVGSEQLHESTDLVLNVASFGVEATADLVAEAFRARFKSQS